MNNDEKVRFWGDWAHKTPVHKNLLIPNEHLIEAATIFFEYLNGKKHHEIDIPREIIETGEIKHNQEDYYIAREFLLTKQFYSPCGGRGNIRYTMRVNITAEKIG